MAFRRRQNAEPVGEVLFDPSKVDLVAVDAAATVVELLIVADAP